MRRSLVWQHFISSDNNREATCKYCDIKLAHKGSTTTLWNHYNFKHKVIGTASTSSSSSGR